MGPPVRDLTFQNRTLQPVSLPGGIISILKRQFLQRGPRFLHPGGVELRNLFNQDALRPTVGYDVMQRKQGHMLALTQFQQSGPYEWPRAQIKGLKRLLLRGSFYCKPFFFLVVATYLL